jgi:hypothetical protein
VFNIRKETLEKYGLRRIYADPAPQNLAEKRGLPDI